MFWPLGGLTRDGTTWRSLARGVALPEAQLRDEFRRRFLDGLQRAYVYGFRVRLQYQGLGIGTRIMEVIESDLFRRGYTCVTLNVAQDNFAARRLYERLGYRVTEVEPGNWHYIDEVGVRHDVHEPAWRMEKQISRGLTL